jgi:antitoxin component YwqK of YwqJK toxin-antitoxin module
LRNSQPHGQWTTYFDDGKTPRAKETFDGGKRQGIRYTYYPSGAIKEEAPYRSNLLTGQVKTYYENGAIESTTEYRNNRRHGAYRSYYADGKIKEEGEYAAGRQHNEWHRYNEQGERSETTLYRAGIPVPADGENHR